MQIKLCKHSVKDEQRVKQFDLLIKAAEKTLKIINSNLFLFCFLHK